jgi:hypothetical protein
MRSHEFANQRTAVNYFSKRPDIIGRIDLGEYTAFLHDHLMTQAQDRDVDEIVLQKVIPKIPQAKAKIRLMGAGQHFWLYDNTNHVALGIQLLNAEHKIFIVRTVWNGRPSSDNVYPIFNVA